MSKYFQALLFILINTCSFSAVSQENIQFHDVSDGISQHTISAITQDDNNFLWLGTKYGLNRYDGFQYVQYYHVHNETNSLIQNNITALATDGSNYLWIGTYSGGVDQYNLKTGQFTHYNTSNGKLLNDYITDLYLDENHRLWIGSIKGGISIIDTKTGLIQSKINSIDFFPYQDKHITSIKGNGSSIVAGCWNGDLLIFDINNSTIKAVSVGNYSVRCIAPSKKNEYLIGTNNGVVTLNLETKEYLSNSTLTESVILSVYIDQSGNKYIGTENDGLYIMSNQGEIENYLANQENFLRPLPGNSIWQIYEDKTGIIWIGFFLNGLCKIDELENKFKTIQRSKSKKAIVQLDLVSALEESENNKLWIGTDGSGLFLLDIETSTLSSYNNIWKSSSDKVVTSLLVDSRKTLWIGTWQEGIKLIKPKTGIVKTIYDSSKINNPKFGNNIKSIFEDKKGNIWVVRLEGRIDILDKNGDLISPFVTPNLGSTDILVLEEDCTGNIIIGTEGSGIHLLGLSNEYNVETKKNYLNNTSEQQYNHTINDLFIDSKCNLWIGTAEGLILKRHLQDTLVAYRKDHGLPSNMILAIEEDQNGLIWASTNNGLFSLNVDSGNIQNYNKQDGLLSNYFSRGSSLRSKSNKLFFGNNSGVNYFHPDSLMSNKSIPNIYITNVYVSDNQLADLDNEKKNLTNFNGHSIKLDHNQNDIRFEYTSVNFTQGEQNKFQYILEGLDDDWQFVDNERYAYYRDLDPGEYTFLLKGANNDNLWNSTPISFSFHIKKPFYNTIIAWILYLICVGSIFYFFVKNLLDREKLQSELELEHLRIEQLKEIDKMKSSFFTNISHEFMTPLTMIIAPFKGMKKMGLESLDEKTASIILSNAERLEKYIRQILDLSKLEFQNVNLKLSKVELNRFLEDLILSFMPIANKRSIKIEKSFPEKSIYLNLDIDKIEQVFINLLSNSIKYSMNNTNIKVKIEEFDNSIDIHIKDKGIGISSENIHLIFNRFYREKGETEINGTGLGLAISKQIIELHNGSISVQSKEGIGSCFTVSLPKNDEILSNNISYFLNKDKSETLHPALEMDNKDEFESIKSEIDDHLPLVLVVEDNIDIRNYIESYLEDSYNILTAEDGLIGYEIAQKNIPDIVITDVMMPNMDGFELCEKLRKNHLTSHIGIIMLTVKSSNRDQKTGFKHGVNYYLNKPFSPELLEIRIKSLLDFRNTISSQIFQSVKLKDKDVFEKLDVNQVDIEFVEAIEKIVLANIQNSKFSVPELSKELAMSQSQFYRKTKAILGCSGNTYIRSVRLKKAAELISLKKHNISEITYMVGFNDLQYFRKCFKSQFGVNPSGYLNSLSN